MSFGCYRRIAWGETVPKATAASDTKVYLNKELLYYNKDIIIILFFTCCIPRLRFSGILYVNFPHTKELITASWIPSIFVQIFIKICSAFQA